MMYYRMTDDNSDGVKAVSSDDIYIASSDSDPFIPLKKKYFGLQYQKRLGHRNSSGSIYNGIIFSLMNHARIF